MGEFGCDKLDAVVVKKKKKSKKSVTEDDNGLEVITDYSSLYSSKEVGGSVADMTKRGTKIEKANWTPEERQQRDKKSGDALEGNVLLSGDKKDSKKRKREADDDFEVNNPVYGKQDKKGKGEKDSKRKKERL